jgi:hypothetical protein
MFQMCGGFAVFERAMVVKQARAKAQRVNLGRGKKKGPRAECR